MKYLTLTNSLWLLLYLLVMAGGLWGLHRARVWALASYGSAGPQAVQRQQAWDDWRRAAAEQAEGKGPVQRRVPKSDEPPTIVLLRDYYAMCVTAYLLFGSVLFATFMFLLRGIFSSPGRIRLDSNA